MTEAQLIDKIFLSVMVLIDLITLLGILYIRAIITKSTSDSERRTRSTQQTYPTTREAPAIEETRTESAT